MRMLFLLSASLHTAAFSGDMERVVREVKMGADVNAYDEDGYTPLLYALLGWKNGPAIRLGPLFIVRKGPLKVEIWYNMVKYLLEHGADPNLRARNGNRTCPLSIAAQIGVEAVKLLLRYGAKPNCRDTNGSTPLHYALLSGKPRSAEALLRAGANINARDRDGRTPAHYAAYSCNTASLYYLYGREDVDWKAVDNEGFTVAMYGVKRCSAEEILRLASFGNNILHKNKYGFNVYHLTMLYSRDEKEAKTMVILLHGEAAGVIKSTTSCGMSALHLAALANRPSLFLYLKEVSGLKDYPVDLRRCFGEKSNVPKGRFYAYQILRMRGIKLTNLGGAKGL